MIENKLIFSDLALNDLEEIVLYISRDSIENAFRFQQKIVDCAKNLIALPKIGTLIPDNKLSSKDYRMLIVDNYILFYKIYSDEIRVLRILNGRRDYPNLL